MTKPRSSRKKKSPVKKKVIEVLNLTDVKFTVTSEVLKNNVCRVCAKYYSLGTDLIPLFQPYPCVPAKPLGDVVNDFLPIKVVKGDGLPEHVCYPCAEKLQEWRKMWQTCMAANKLLHSHSDLTSQLRLAPSIEPDDADVAPHPPEDVDAPQLVERKRGVQKHGCTTCGRVFGNAGNLARHVDAVHAMRRPHVCGECGRAFARGEHLREHSRVHVPACPLLCDACGAACPSAAALRSHRRVHGPRTLACACGAQFRRAGELRAHATVHAGTRSHRCWCGRAFRLRAQLNMHARRHQTRQESVELDTTEGYIRNQNS